MPWNSTPGFRAFRSEGLHLQRLEAVLISEMLVSSDFRQMEKVLWATTSLWVAQTTQG